MDLGFLTAGFEPVWANDIDRFAVETYRRNIGSHIALGDVRNQNIPGPGSADVVIGGPPCQGFSVAGKMDPNDPRSRHVWDFLAVVEHIKPRAFVMENVAALAENQRWTSLRDALIRTSRQLGYRTKLFVLTASDYGVPQNRQRMFLIGVRQGSPRAPKPVTAKSPPSLRDVLSRLPAYGSAGNDLICPARVTVAAKPVLRRSPYAGMLFNGQGRPLDLNRPASTLPASMGGNRTPIIDQQQLEQAGESWVVEYHRHLRGGGAPCSSVPSSLRRITVQEAAAIQTFPPEMEFVGPLTTQYRQIGNAVPPMLAYHVAEALKGSLDGAEEPTKEVEADQLTLLPDSDRELIQV